MWLFALWPLASLPVAIVFALLGGYSTQSLSGYSTTAPLATGVNAVLTIVWYLMYPLFAFQDSRELKARQLPSPFGWGWGFLPLVYGIGRSVVVYNRTGRGLAPLFVLIGAGVGAQVLGFILGVALALSGVV
jgi:hypothetical protein